MNLIYAKDDEIRDAIAKDGKIKAILPIGSLEQHGRHLPLATDTMIAEYIASRVSERLNSLLLPPIHYGVSYEHRPLFNISIEPKTLTALIDDICSSLLYNGVSRMIMLNAHYPNNSVIEATIRGLSPKYPNLMIASIPYWKFIGGIDHAGEKETSLILAIDGSLVDLSEIGEKGFLQESLSSVVLDSVTLLAGSIPALTNTGVIGDASRSDKKKGESMLRHIIDSIVDTINLIESVYERYLNNKR
jgi:creatinine amidohydrolase